MDTVWKLSFETEWNSNLVQILVVVAIIQMKPLKADEEKGFMWTVFDHEWIDPKTQINLINDKIELISVSS